MFSLRRAAMPMARSFSTAAPRSSFAKMTIIGRLADTPELQPTSTGQEILKYVVGTNSGPRDNQKTSWFRVTSFIPEGPQRDFIAGLDKGYVYLFYRTWRMLWDMWNGRSRDAETRAWKGVFELGSEEEKHKKNYIQFAFNRTHKESSAISRTSANSALRRTLVYVEGNASMDVFQDAEGKSRSALNIVQRMSHSPFNSQIPKQRLTIAQSALRFYLPRSRNKRLTSRHTTPRTPVPGR